MKQPEDMKTKSPVRKSRTTEDMNTREKNIGETAKKVYKAVKHRYKTKQLLTKPDKISSKLVDKTGECQFCNKKAILNKRFRPTPEYSLAYDLCDGCAKKHKEAYLSLVTKTNTREWKLIRQLGDIDAVDGVMGMSKDDMKLKVIHEYRTETLREVEEMIKESTLCDYPKADTQKEHNKNMVIVDRAEKQAKFLIKHIITTLLNQVTNKEKK